MADLILKSNLKFYLTTKSEYDEALNQGSQKINENSLYFCKDGYLIKGILPTDQNPNAAGFIVAQRGDAIYEALQNAISENSAAIENNKNAITLLQEQDILLQQYISLLEQDIDNIYTKTQVDDKITPVVEDIEDINTAITDIQTELDKKALTTDVYNKTETYSQTEVDNKLTEKVDKITYDPKIQSIEASISGHTESINNLSANKANISVVEALDETLIGVKEAFENHADNQNNPHNVTATQLGLGNVLTDIQALQGADEDAAAEHLRLQKEIDDVNDRVDAHVEQARTELTEAIAIESIARQDLGDIVNSNLEKIAALERSSEDISLRVDNNTEEIENLKESNIGAGSGLTDDDRALLDYIRTFFNLSNPDKNQIIIGDAILTCVELDDETKKLEITFS